MTCKRMPNTPITDVHCDVKYVRRNYLRFDIWANLSQALHEGWLLTKGYYQYNSQTYQRFLNEFWVNGCDWLTGKAKSYVLDWTIGRALKVAKHNINHPCPYGPGHLYFKIDNISVYHFPVEPLIPAGRYRIDAFATNRNRSIIAASASVKNTSHC